MPEKITTKTATEPLIRWAGSKRRLLNELYAASPSRFGTYYEPFFGSGCLFFRLRPRYAVVGDVNAALINFYKEVKASPARVLASAVRYRRGCPDYYRIRDRFHGEKDKGKHASMFLYLNRYCFNAIYRTNDKGLFNVPYGTRTGSFPPRRRFLASASLLENARVECDDFENVLKTVNADDFVYLDPPYAYSQHRDRGEYGKGSFKVPDLPRLKRVLSILDTKKVKFLLSYIDCPEMVQIARKFHAQSIPVKRCIASLTSSRQTVNELLVRNF